MGDDTAKLTALVENWIRQDPDEHTRAEAQALLDSARGGASSALEELRACFDGRLSFGTAGLRAELGAGPKRMNRVVVSQTSAGFAAFLWERLGRGETSSPPTVVIGYDGRVNSDVFARDTAEIMAGAGVRAILLPEPLPTPVTAFAVRHLGTSAGVMVTASHNPPRDNGYKVYLGDADEGAQIAPPIDAAIAAHIDRVSTLPLDELPRSNDYTIAGAEVIDAYVTQTANAVLHGLPLDPITVPLRVAYTAMHGVGSNVARRVFSATGLPPVTAVPEQDQPNGEFPTVEFPNPEEPGALDLAIRTARQIDADIIVAHDPDADRLAIAVPAPDSASVSAPAAATDRIAQAKEFRAVTGNQLGLLLGWRAAERERRAAKREDRPVAGTLACTIVSSPALGAVAKTYGLDYEETLSGFKWVARVPGLIFGFEEALGYLTHPAIVHDKDGISASADAISMVRELRAHGRTLWDLLDEAAERFGAFASSQVTVRLDSMAAVEALAEQVRAQPPSEFGSITIERTTDLLTPGLAAVPANVLRYDLADGSRVMIRPSGTEPKLKVYLDTMSEVGSAAERTAAAEEALQHLESAVREYLDLVGS